MSSNLFPLDSPDTALKALSLAEMLWELVAAGAELKGILHLFKHLLVVPKRYTFGLPLDRTPELKKKKSMSFKV